MEFIQSIPLVGGFLSTVLPFLVVLGIVVFVHEYGHYIVGRWCGIRAEVFSLGFGPVLTRWQDRRGTTWQLAALPLGGYVKFLGDADGSSRADPEQMAHLSPEDRAHSFHGAALWKRALTVLAGPVANFVLSVTVFAGLTMWQGVATEVPTIGSVADWPEAADAGIRPGDQIVAVEGQPVTAFRDVYDVAEAMPSPGPVTFTVRRDGTEIEVTAPFPLPALVHAVEPLSPASRAGLEAGDFIRAVDGNPVGSFSDLRAVIAASGGRTLELDLVRAGQPMTLSITPLLRDTDDGEGGFEKRVMIGISGGMAYFPATETPAPWTAVRMGAERVYQVVSMSLNALKHIVIGQLGAENLQGPLGIAQISGETASQGLVSFVTLVAVLSTAIGMLNLFPVPVLDGGHLAIFAYEGMTGHPPRERVLRIAMSIGLAMVLLLMLFATYNDIMRWLFVS
jgi:regulator of sigma E protease